MTTTDSAPSTAARLQFVTSPDGTVIAYHSRGRGPGLVLVPGSLATAADYDELAANLAAHVTVHTIERRGRGDSGPQGPAYGLDREREDVEAVRAATGSTFLVGHSFGGLVGLEALLAGSRFAAAAVYEPGVTLDEPTRKPPAWAARCGAELAAGRDLAAFITFVRGVNPETTGRAPRALLRVILPLAIRGEERKQKYGLLPGAVREHEAAAALGGGAARYAPVDVPVLFLNGKGRANTEAGRAAEVLSATLPAGRLRHYPRLDHFGPQSDPVRVAADIVDFFSEVAPHE